MFKKLKKNIIISIFNKSRTKLLETKNGFQMKNTLKDIKNKLATAEQNISELEDTTIKPT